MTGEDSKTLSFEPLLVIDDQAVQVGAPTVAGVMVKAEVLGEVKGEKLQILKFKAKKRVNTKTGHRQRYTQIKITSIGAAKSAAKAETKPATKKATKAK